MNRRSQRHWFSMQSAIIYTFETVIYCCLKISDFKLSVFKNTVIHSDSHERVLIIYYEKGS